MLKSKTIKIALIALSLVCFTAVLAACAESDPSVGSDIPYDYDLSSFVELGQYKNIELEAQAPLIVTDEEIQIEIDNMMQYYKTAEYVSEGTLAEGDIVNMDFVGRIDNEEFAGGTAEDYDLQLGSGMFIAGFEDAMVGHEVGETFIIPLTFPSDYHQETLAGKDVEFEVTVNSIVLYHDQELTDEFVAENLDGFSSIADLKENIRNSLLESKTYEQQNMRMNEAWLIVVDNAKIKRYPQGEIDRYINEVNELYANEAKNYDLTVPELINEMHSGMTMDQFNEDLRVNAENYITEELIIRAIVKAENIEITDDEYTALLQVYVDNMYNVNSIQELEDMYGKDNLISSLLWDKVLELIVDNAVDV